MLILRSLSPPEREATLDDLPERVRAEYSELLEFPERTAGRFMDRLSASYHSDQTVGEALEALRQSGVQRTRSLYLVTREGVLTGRVDLQDMPWLLPMR